MTEIQYLYEKYKTRDIIEIDGELHKKILEWVTGFDKNLKASDSITFAKIMENVNRNGFIRFLDKGVIFAKASNSELKHRYLGAYPFEYSDSGNTVTQSIYIVDPREAFGQTHNPLKMLCKVEYDKEIDKRIVDGSLIIDGTWNSELAGISLAAEIEDGRINRTGLKAIAETLTARGVEPTDKRVHREYFMSIIFAQILLCIGTNAYFALLDKQNLVGRILQTHTPKASGRTQANRSKRNPLYRYMVNIPAGYNPRHLDLTYLLREWSRSGHKAIRWVRHENAQLLADRAGGKVLGDRTKGDYVAIEIPIKPQVCHRSPEVLKDRIGEEGVKTYKP